MQLTSKKPLIIGSILLLLIIFSGAYFFVQKKQSKEIVEPEQPVRRRISEPVNVIDISQRPVVSIIPHTDGNHLTIKILSLNKPANSAHYLLEYQAGSSLRGLEADLELATLNLIPWQPGYARIVCDGHVGGKPYEFDSRVVLKKQIERLSKNG